MGGELMLANSSGIIPLLLYIFSFYRRNSISSQQYLWSLVNFDDSVPSFIIGSTVHT